MRLHKNLMEFANVFKKKPTKNQPKTQKTKKGGLLVMQTPIQLNGSTLIYRI